ncbi:type I-E CRISPR-associated protein Cas5/CasD, partial [Streptomyces sp. NPDC000351]|uniref:type I-E CRISPR-associated protein Cas5/CasD n=1 Tax=Streptomyces sp. NPDC000351 TaxID=3154250 RepID=UPI00332CC453
MNGHVLRLAGPMQSRGERSTFNPDGDTAPFPTLLGVLAAAQSITRQDTSALNHHAAPEFTVRTDQPGGRLVDYHPPRPFLRDQRLAQDAVAAVTDESCSCVESISMV